MRSFPDYSDDRPNHLLTDLPERDFRGGPSATFPRFPDYSDDRPNHLLTDLPERDCTGGAERLLVPVLPIIRTIVQTIC